ncbi:MAG: 23S rRNA (uracil(1939)-C(5))-methyltransferase RlmD [Planctomycetes bacterium]|nr:23S rRNA (uracil(1939)-C(5))-methyltransferase RlmD [Planctomycetota bacterium]
MTLLDCPYRDCPGCPARDSSYAEQLEKKRSRLLAALARFPSLAGLAVEPIVPSPHITGYRHRAKLPVLECEGQVHLGLFAATGHRVLDTPECPVLAPALREALSTLREFLAARGLAAPEGPVAAIDARLSSTTGEIQLALACRDGSLPGGEEAARELLAAVPGLTSVALSRADPRGVRVLGSQPRVLAGSPSIEEKIGGVSLGLEPGAFFQVDPRRAAVLVGLVAGALSGCRRILDVYCGAGTYALALASRAEEVLGLDEVAASVESARSAAREAGLEGRVRFVQGQSEKLLGHGAVRESAWDGIVLNPARRGSDPVTLAALAQFKPRSVVYVSCDPETLARDLDTLHWRGFSAQRIVPVDLFPQTWEVETVAVLSAGERPSFPATEGLVPGGRAVDLPPWQSAPEGTAFEPPAGASGVAVSGPEPDSVKALALVRGRTRPAQELRGGGYRRVEEIAGHSLVRLEARPATLRHLLTSLARTGHPVLGDPRSGVATCRWFRERAALVRPFLHIEEASGPGWQVTSRGIPGDLAIALDRLRGSGAQSEFGSGS